MFPSVEETDDKLVRELVEGGRSVTQARRVLAELAGACREAAVELEALLEVCVMTFGSWQLSQQEWYCMVHPEQFVQICTDDSF